MMSFVTKVLLAKDNGISFICNIVLVSSYPYVDDAVVVVVFVDEFESCARNV